ncbi:19089_t:CDS:2, partial [Racocetra persica]
LVNLSVCQPPTTTTAPAGPAKAQEQPPPTTTAAKGGPAPPAVLASTPVSEVSNSNYFVKDALTSSTLI